MWTLLLTFALLGSVPDAQTTTFAPAVAQDGLQAKNFEILPVCAPPAFGPWWVWCDGVLLGAHTAPQAVVVLDGVSLHLAAGASLDVDFDATFLWIGDGSRVLIGPGARID